MYVSHIFGAWGIDNKGRGLKIEQKRGSRRKGGKERKDDEEEG